MPEFLLLAAVAFGPLAFGCVEPWSLAVLEILLFSLALAGSRRRPAAGPLLSAVLVLLAIGAAQWLNPEPIAARHGLLPFTASAYGTRKALLLWCAYAVLLWQAPSVLSQAGASRRLLWLIVLLGLFVALSGMFQLSQGNRLIYGFRPVPSGSSPFGPYYNRGHAASLLALSALTGAGLFLSRLCAYRSRRGDRSSLPDFIATQALLFLVLGVIAAGWLITRNRGSLIAGTLSVWIMAMLGTRFMKSRAAAWTIRAALVLALAVLAAAAPALLARLHGVAVSVPWRLAMNRGGLELLADFPLWGTGLGSVVTAFYAYKEPIVVGVVDHVHNDWLELLLQTGLIGFSAFAAGLAVLARRVYRAWSAEPSLERRCLMGGAMAAALSFIIHGIAEFSFQIPANAVLFFSLVCWLSAQTRRSGSLDGRNPIRPASARAPRPSPADRPERTVKREGPRPALG